MKSAITHIEHGCSLRFDDGMTMIVLTTCNKWLYNEYNCCLNYEYVRFYKSKHQYIEARVSQDRVGNWVFDTGACCGAKSAYLAGGALPSINTKDKRYNTQRGAVLAALEYLQKHDTYEELKQTITDAIYLVKCSRVVQTSLF